MTAFAKTSSAPSDALEHTLSNCPVGARDALQAVLQGEELSLQQGLQLATAESAALEALVAVADHLRRETVGEAVTYVVNRNINFTNV